LKACSKTKKFLAESLDSGALRGVTLKLEVAEATVAKLAS
jgi:hypothetical protein